MAVGLGIADAGAGAGQGPTALARLRARAEAALLAQRGSLAPWVPVALGAGIGLHLGAPVEPGAAVWAAVAALGVAALAGARPAGAAWGPLLLAVALVAAGAGLSGWRTASVAAPVLSFRYYGAVEGRIVGIDRSASDALRLTLDRVVLDDVPPERTPARVRVSLHGDQRWLAAEPGRVVLTTAHLAPPPGPTEPGAFDFRRQAWFEGLGAIGYTRTPVLTRAPPEGGLWVHRVRAWASGWLRARIPGDPGGLAAAVTTGDRSGLSQAASDAMRDSGLYHIVSISGMHMALVVGFVFALVRTGVALVPPVALRVDGKKVAALAAFPVAAGYLALAGRDVATERAFAMAAVALGAILLDRRAMSLRSVAVAATAVLVLRPESLVNAGFQMSFAAALALTLAFATPWSARLPRAWAWARAPLTLVASSLVAGLATAPFTAAQFGRTADYGLLANLLAVPAMGLLVMPGAVLLALGAPLGLTQPALLMMELGSAWVLFVAERVAGIEGAARAIPAAPAATVPLMALGALATVLWRGRLRWAGLAGPAAALALWIAAERPSLLVAETGGVVGVLGPDGRALSSGTGETFVTGAWLARDGDLAEPEAAAARPGLSVQGRLARAEAGGATVLSVRGSRALAALDGCDGADLLVTDQPDAGPRPCLALDATDLRGTGAVAGWAGPEGVRLETVAARAGDRPWTGGPPPPALPALPRGAGGAATGALPRLGEREGRP